MNPFLDDFVDSLTFRASRRASELFNSAKVDKTHLENVLAKLDARQIFPNYIAPFVVPNDVIRSRVLSQNFRDAYSYIQEMFEVSNESSILLDNVSTTLLSEIKQIEDELNMLEKSADNYAFLLSDGKAYDYAFLESFNDEIHREEPEWSMTDRAGQVFEDFESASVDTAEGSLSIFSTIRKSYPFTARIYSTNKADVASDTGVGNIENPDTTTGWRRVVTNPRPISNTLPPFVGMHGSTYEGLQVILELQLTNPSPCDTIRLHPLANSNFDLVQAIIWVGEDGTEKKQLLRSAIPVDRLQSLYFPLQNVHKVQLYLHQPLYMRQATSDSHLPSEAYYRRVSEHFLREIYPDGQYLDDRAIRRMALILSEINSALDGLATAIPSGTESKYPNGSSLQLAEVLRRVRDLQISNEGIRNDSIAGALIMKLVKQLVLNDYDDIFGILTDKKSAILTRGAIDPDYNVRFGNVVPRGHVPLNTTSNRGSDPIQPSPDPEDSDVPHNEPNLYRYTIGLNFVELGTTANSHKAGYMTKVLPSPGDLGEVRLKVEDENAVIDTTVLDNSGLATSVEYSVSNRSEPRLESDWVPILPIGTESVVGERFFIDSGGKGLFRFEASADDSILLYKNGSFAEVDIPTAAIYSLDKSKVTGLILDRNLYATTDFLTVDYTPAVDKTTINFSKVGFAQAPLTTVFDNEGPGEKFSGGAPRTSVSLKYAPYVDYAAVELAAYDEDFGMGPYNPVTIKLADGTYAVNLTNYKGPASSPLNPNADEIQFYHTGKNITFNRAVEDAFMVSYQYLPSNIRVRIVMRSNTNDFMTPKVKAFQLKGKMRASDAKRHM